MRINILRRLYSSLSKDLPITMENPRSKKLSDMTAEELREEVVRLRVTNTNLVNIMKNQTNSAESKWVQRPFDYNKSRKRHILLWISYFGWSFDGFVTQTHTTNSVEDIVKKSLFKVHLAQDLENYSRCGRTDKGVSAFSQVLSLDIRSIQPFDHSPLTTPELPYCSMLNKVFPPDLRAIAWRPAREGYDARHECIKRTYKYFFPRGNFNIEAMQEACTLLEGTHDFRNLCKMDVANGVVQFIRTIDSAKIEQLDFQQDINPAFNMYSLTINSSGFLYHQIRCIMHVLILVGEGNERPDIVTQLMDIEKNPRKPQYPPAHELPLNLFSVEYPADEFDWVFNEDSTGKLERFLLDEWTLQSCKTVMMRSVINEVTKLNPVKSNEWLSSVLKPGAKGKHHLLMTRQRGESLEERIDHYVKKRKLMIVKNEDGETRVQKVPKMTIDVDEDDPKKAAMIELSNIIDQVKEESRSKPEKEETAAIGTS